MSQLGSQAQTIDDLQTQIILAANRFPVNGQNRVLNISDFISKTGDLAFQIDPRAGSFQSTLEGTGTTFSALGIICTAPNNYSPTNTVLSLDVNVYYEGDLLTVSSIQVICEYNFDFMSSPLQAPYIIPANGTHSYMANTNGTFTTLNFTYDASVIRPNMSVRFYVIVTQEATDPSAYGDFYIYGGLISVA